MTAGGGRFVSIFLILKINCNKSEVFVLCNENNSIFPWAFSAYIAGRPKMDGMAID